MANYRIHVGTKDAAYKCRTIRRKTEDLAYDPKCVDSIKIGYNEYILKDARTSVAVTRHPGPAGGPIDPVPTRGKEFVPRRIYTRPADFERHVYTQGCRGCAWVETKIGPRVPHTEECRQRIEEAMGADEIDDRAKKVKERSDHCAAQQVGEADFRGEDPREKNEPKEDAAPEPAEEEVAMDGGTEKYDIGTPDKMEDDEEGLGSDDLADGPNTTSERRLHTPVTPAAVKRRNDIHDEEPDTTKIIWDDDDENMEGGRGADLDEVRAQREDEEIVCR